MNATRCEKPGIVKAVEKIAESATNYDPDQISVAYVEDHYSQH